MNVLPSARRGPCVARWSRCLGVTFLVLGCGLPARAEAPPPVPPRLDLHACLKLALKVHPRLAVQRASLDAAEVGKRALDGLRESPLLGPELPIRRQQAELGVRAAASGLEQAEREIVYNVTRNYFTALYAREQERVAGILVDRLTVLLPILPGRSRDKTGIDAERAGIYLRISQTRRLRARHGEQRALAALREAMGQGPEFCFALPPGRLPEATSRPCREEILAATLQRSELLQARLFADIVGLEIKAQSLSHGNRKETFAAGADIHARHVAGPSYSEDDYHPGASPPAMPTLLAGSKTERAQRAAAYSERADAAVVETKHLLALQADDAFHRWQEAAEQLPLMRTSETSRTKIFQTFLDGLLDENPSVRVENFLDALLLQFEAQLQTNQILHRALLALADLERVTGGVFCAGLADLALPEVPAVVPLKLKKP